MAPGSPQSGVGRIIAGRYLLLDRIGSGGMGHVWLAHDQRLDCDVALKEIRFRNPAEGPEEHEGRIARARAEARHAAVLRSHPHVVTVHDVLEDEGLPWIVMEYVAGAEDLRAALPRRGPLAPYECARIGLAVLDALTAGHEHGIMHRDVKPANILLAPDRTGTPGARILLTDYGISVQPDSLETRWTRTSALVGTPGYLAPERATGGPPTAAADLFSLGCTLYYLVEGVGPFDRETDLAAITAVVLEDPRPAQRAGALGPLVEALLVKDPAHRLSAEDAAAALARIITPELRPPTPFDTGSQPPWAGLATSDGSRGQGGATPAPYTPTALDSSGRVFYDPSAQDIGAAAPYTPTALGSDTPAAWTPTPPGFGPPLGYGTPPPGTPWPGPSGRRRRKRPRLLLTLSSALLALGLAGGGYWYAMGHQVVLPYGHAVGLAEPLKVRDCVSSPDDTPEHVTSSSHLEVDTGCKQNIGQVMALYKAPSVELARSQGPARCEGLTRGTAGKLGGNVRSLAVVPTGPGFKATGGEVACLLVGKANHVFGPLDGFRAYGMVFNSAAQIQKGDCVNPVDGDARTHRGYKLVSCDKPHQDQVVDFTYLDGPVSGDGNAQDAADAQCAKDVPSGPHGLLSKNVWADGYYLVVCAAPGG
ncbi:serine/threonine-protein kinase [Streptomyces sp. SAS_270]|uniref:serine/threonine-protein kinase n=1 Tax=Streptomyces sp. SAS_270 TaxID=3412748 RepID=UPI00403C864C